MKKYKHSLLIFAILFKLSLSFLLLVAKGYPENSLKEIMCGGDCSISYVPAAENIYKYGQFTIYDNMAPYTGRMPGYELILNASRLFSGSKEISFFFIVVFQSIMAGISMYFLTSLTYNLFKNNIISIFTFALYGISTYVSLYDIYGLTESLSTSFFIIAFSLLVNKQHNNDYIIKLVIGFLLLFCILLRQYILPFFLLWTIYIIYIEYKRNSKRKKIFFSVLLFLFPLICFEAFWVLRNYQQKEKLILLVDSLYAGYDSPNAKTQGFYISPKLVALIKFTKAWGGDIIWWNTKAEITAFISSPPKSKAERKQTLNSFPKYIYTSEFSENDLIEIQNTYSQNKYSYEIINKLNSYRESFKNEKPFYYYVVAPIRLSYKFLVHSGTYNLFNKTYSELNIFEKLTKIFYTALYFFILLAGVTGSIILIYNNAKNIEFLMLVATALYIIVLTSFILKRIEYRHFVFAYPYFTILSSYFVYKVGGFIRNLYFKFNALQ